MGLHSAVSVVARTARLAARILVAMLRRVPSCALSALLGRAEGAADSRARIAVDSGEMGRPIQITVIVPCYNEEAGITDAVLSALQDDSARVIVVDGGSSDGTAARLRPLLAGHARVSLLTGGKSRADSQRIGAAAAAVVSERGGAEEAASVLLLLHADSALPPRYGALIRAALNDERARYCGGAFSFRLDRPDGQPLPHGLRLIEWGTNVRARRLAMPYGDQALFLRRSVYDALGGFQDLPLLEDVELVAELRRRGGRLCVLDAPVTTSGRRWRMSGAAQNTLMNQVVLMGWRLGVPHAELVKWYYGMAAVKGY